MYTDIENGFLDRHLLIRLVKELKIARIYQLMAIIGISWGLIGSFVSYFLFKSDESFLIAFVSCKFVQVKIELFIKMKQFVQFKHSWPFYYSILMIK